MKKLLACAFCIGACFAAVHPAAQQSSHRAAFRLHPPLNFFGNSPLARSRLRYLSPNSRVAGNVWRIRMHSLPLYEAKYRDREEWQEISEIELMEGLYKVFKKVTPALEEMIEGKEIDTPKAVYRLRIKGGDPSSTLAT